MTSKGPIALAASANGMVAAGGFWSARHFNEVTGLGNVCGTLFATGWGKASAILKVFTPRDGRWSRYRLPMASHTFDHGWSAESPAVKVTRRATLARTL